MTGVDEGIRDARDLAPPPLPRPPTSGPLVIGGE